MISSSTSFTLSRFTVSFTFCELKAVLALPRKPHLLIEVVKLIPLAIGCWKKFKFSDATALSFLILYFLPNFSRNVYSRESNLQITFISPNYRNELVKQYRKLWILNETIYKFETGDRENKEKRFKPILKRFRWFFFQQNSSVYSWVVKNDGFRKLLIGTETERITCTKSSNLKIKSHRTGCFTLDEKNDEGRLEVTCKWWLLYPYKTFQIFVKCTNNERPSSSLYRLWD